MTPDEIKAQLEKILGSAMFATSARMGRFLRHIVCRSLENRADELKESVIGLEVFDRDATYDSRLDPIVRVEARRLRSKLGQYYAQEGRGDAILIDLPRGGYAPVFRLQQQDPPASAKTIAVLPFANLSADAENQYFSDGLTRELIHELTRVPGLRVVAWNTVSQLREKAGKPREIAELLNADVVLEGSVQRAGRRVRITAQLVEASSGVYLWSETYQREIEDLFALQEEIAQALAFVLKVRLAQPEVRQTHCSAEAYNSYLQGRFAWNQRSELSLRQSIVWFERAIQEDPRCALAYAGVADSYSLLCDFGFLPAEEAIPLARQAACRALEIDPTLGEAHCSLAMILSNHDWNWEMGGEHYRRSLELNPGYVTAHHWFSIDYLALLGRFDEAAREMSTARRLDPLDLVLELSEGYLCLLARQFDESVCRHQEVIRKAPDMVKAYSGLGRTLGAQGRYPEAIAMLEKARSIVGDQPNLLGALGQIHGANGNPTAARRLLRALEQTARQRHVSTTCFAVIHLGLGEKQEALDWLAKGVERRELPLSALGVHPIYDDLRGEPRFQDLLTAVGLSSVRSEAADRLASRS